MSAYPFFNYGVLPYMNNRAWTGAPLNKNGDIGFSSNADIVITWLDEGTNPVLANGIIEIYAHGRWGTDSEVIDHRLFVFAKYAAIGAPTITVAVKEFLNAGNASSNPQYTVAYVSTAGQQGYWTNYGGMWYRLVQATNHGIVNVYANLGLDPAVMPPTGIDATKYSISIRQSDLNYIATQQPDPTQKTYVPVLVPSSGRYDLCWMNNSMHAQLHDAAFYILPDGYREYDEIPDRTELNSRVAGEKALYEDEFLTAGQIEGSANVTLRWRNIDGSLTGYPTNASKGGNLVIEATGGGGGNSAVQGRSYGPFHTNPAATIYYDETTATIRFQDEPLWYTDAMVNIPDTKLPIEFDVIGDPVVNPTVSVIRARAINNNLHCSVTPLNGINYYPMALANAPVLADYTVNHIRFVDTTNITWNVSGDVMPTLMPDGSTAVRQGIIINPVLNGLYVNWSVKSGKPDIYNSRRQQTAYNDNGLNVNYTVDSLDTVEFFGKNGVVCTLEGLFANQLRVMIDRRLSVQSSNNKQQIGDNTTRIEFRSFLGQDSIELFPFSSGDDSNLQDIRYSLSYFSSNINVGGSRFRTPVLPVTFTVNGSSGINESDVRIVRGWYPKNVRRWSSQWSKDYDNTNTDTYRVLSNNPANQVLPIGFWGWGSTSNGETVYTPAAGSDWNMIAGDSQDAPWYNFRYSNWNTAYPGGPQEMPIGLQIPWEDGLYFIQATVQGIMGINALPGQMNPVVSQAVHFYLITAPDSSIDSTENFQARTLQSLDIMRDYDYVPQTVQVQTGYMQAVNSRPWSMQGSGMFYLKQRERIFGLLTYNSGNGENRFYYQVCYVKMNCFKVSSSADMKLGSITIDADGDPTMYKYAPQRWHDMNFY